MPNWAAAKVTTSDGETYGSIVKGERPVQIVSRVGVRSIRVLQDNVVLAEKAGVVAETRGARERTVTFDDGTTWYIMRAARDCGCR